MSIHKSDFLAECLANYTNETMKAKAKMCSKLFSIFTECTGYRPEDLCLVEQRLSTETIYFFDLKHRYQTFGVSNEQKT